MDDISVKINKRALLNGVPVFVRRLFRVNDRTKVCIETSADITNLDIDNVKSIIFAEPGKGRDNMP